MDRGSCWNSKIRQATEDLLAALNEFAHFAGFRRLQQRLQIRAGDKDRFFCRCDDQAAQRSVFLHGIELIIQLIESRGVENVRARVGTIEREHANVIVAGLPPNHWSCSNCGHYLHFGTFPRKCQVQKTRVNYDASIFCNVLKKPWPGVALGKCE